MVKFSNSILFRETLEVADFMFFFTDEELIKKEVRRSEIGGKTWGLVHLKRSGFAVPEFAVVPSIGVERKIWRDNAQLCEHIRNWVERIRKLGSNIRIILRSSSRLEDRKESTYAGVFKSCVIENPEKIFIYIEEILHHFNEESKRRKLGGEGLSIILQRYIAGKISGVCFSVEPMRAHPEVGYAECVLGSNESLVKGSVIPTRFTFTFFPPRILEFLCGKESPSNLDEEILNKLVECLLKMEVIFKYPVDVEWTWDGEKVWFLQVRYVSSLKPDKSLLPSACATSWFFNQRFIEPITPFTRTTLLPRIIKFAHSDALSMRGVKESEVEPFFFTGQVYIYHKVYIDILKGCPYWWLSNDLKQLFPGNCPCNYRKKEIIGFWFWFNSLYQLFRNGRHSLLVLRSWKHWLSKAKTTLSKIEKVNFDELSPEKWLFLWNELQSINEEFLSIHRWAILWANYVYRLGGAHIIELLRRFDLVQPSITQVANRRFVKYLRTGEEEIRKEIIAEYGHRSENLDYSSPRWEEIIEELREFMENDIPVDVYNEKKTEKSVLLKSLLHFLVLFCRIPVRFVNLREEQRFEWEKILYAQRQLVLKAGKKMQEKNLIENVEDVWFLTWEEFSECFLKGKEIPSDIISRRKHEWCVFCGFNKPLFISIEQGYQIEEPHGLILKGMGVSYGRVRGRVHLMISSEDLFPTIPKPRILVGQSLNPGQTWCLELWDGFILETGSELSHPAILAREYKVPMIVGIESATSVLQENELVEMDCDKGIVKILKGENYT